MTITLTFEDLMVALTKTGVRLGIAIKNQKTGYASGLKSHRTMARRIGDGVMGELTEMAASRLLGTQITSALGNMQAADLGNGIEIRSTERPNGCLLLHDTCKDDTPYVLAVINQLTITLVGWIYARDGKRPELWREGDPACYYVPQSELRPMEDLAFDNARIGARLGDVGTAAKS